jgi:D-glycero-D-manno-heptose 1,7-bisphosphate phosphatase
MAVVGVPVLYLDLDGTVREGKDDALGRFVNGPADVRVFPEAVVMMRRWKDGGGRIVAITNQGGVALGLMSMADMLAGLRETDRQCGGLFDTMSFCIHHPDAADPKDARCWCRKPSAGAVAVATTSLWQRFSGERYWPHMSLFVGDRPEDQACAANSSIDFQWAAEWRAMAGVKVK